MKKKIIFASLLAISLSAVSQEHKSLAKEFTTCNCNITQGFSNLEKNESDLLKKSIDSYDWSSFRLEKERRKVIFQNGVTIILFSNEEIDNPTIVSTEVKNYKEIRNSHYIPTFDKNGNIMMLIPTDKSKKTTTK